MATYSATVTQSLVVTEGRPSQIPRVSTSVAMQSTAIGVIPRVTSTLVVGQTIGPFVQVVTSSLAVGQTISKSIYKDAHTSVITVGHTISTVGSILYAPYRSTNSVGVQQVVSVIKNLAFMPSDSLGIRSHAVGYFTNVRHIYSPWKG